jgi:ABC-type branched-subunit amino acid transport system substrate-binding protein
MRRGRRTGVLLLLALVVGACGTTLSDQEAARDLRKDGGGTAADVVAGGDASAGEPGPDGTADAGSPTGSAAPGAPSVAATGADTASGSGGAGPTAAATGSAAPAGDGARTPSGRNVSAGGATDVGVSATEIKVGWVGTLTGPQPGLFRGALIGTQAWANYQNSQGGLMGRKITVVSGDDALDSGKNRAAHLQLKDKVFAFVGSFSINDDGGATVVNQCACPDVTGNLSAAMHNSPYHFGPQPAPLGWRSGPARYYAQKYGKPVIEKLAFFYSQVGAAIPLAQQQRRVYEAAGFKVVYERGVPPNDSNQTADVVQMQRAGVRAIAFQGDLVALSKLANAMRQQNFKVDLLNFGNTIYDSNTFKVTSPDALQNAQIDQVYGLFLGEDAGRIPEVKLYNDWMKKTDPNQPVDLFSMYGWLSGRLFADAMNKMADGGKTPVRKDLIDTLKTWGTWDGYGMVAPVNIGQKRPSDCFFIFTVTPDKRFQRTLPAGDKNYECGLGPFSYKP